jgi:hypothetical protein
VLTGTARHGTKRVARAVLISAVAGGIVDGEHHHLFSGQIGKLLQHEWDYYGPRLRGARALRELDAACENQCRSKSP